MAQAPTTTTASTMTNHQSRTLPPYAEDLITTALDHNILLFGSFTLKSGRVSPYFYNAGLFHSGHLLTAIGSAYAAAIHNAQLDFDVVFGPAYKGIALAAVTAVELTRLDPKRYGHVGFTYNRKEKKDHGEGGSVVGAPLQRKRVLLLDDVMTAGTAMREAIQLIQVEGGQVCGAVVNLDRQETAREETMQNDGHQPSRRLSAVQELEAEYGFKVLSVVTMTDIIAYMKLQPGREKEVEAMEEYRRRWGIESIQ